MMEQANREGKEIKIYGMSCQHCVNHVTKILEKFPSVEQVQVSLADSKATFTWEPSQVNLEDVQKEIEEGGYSLEPLAVELEPEDPDDLEQIKPGNSARDDEHKESVETKGESSIIDPKLQFRITGMTCANCALTIEKGLRNLPGVKSAAVNFASEKLTVEADPKVFKDEDLLAKIKDLGYSAQSADEGKQQFKVSGMTCANCALAIEKNSRVPVVFTVWLSTWQVKQ